MAEIIGYAGEVALISVLASDVAWNTHSWSLNVGAAIHDVTNFKSTGWKKNIGGLKEWSGDVEMYIASDVAIRIQPSDVGTEVVGRFYMSDTIGLTGKCIIKDWNPAVSVDGVETQKIGVQGSSDLFPL